MSSSPRAPRSDEHLVEKGREEERRSAARRRRSDREAPCPDAPRRGTPLRASSSAITPPKQNPTAATRSGSTPDLRDEHVVAGQRQSAGVAGSRRDEPVPRPAGARSRRRDSRGRTRRSQARRADRHEPGRCRPALRPRASTAPRSYVVADVQVDGQVADHRHAERFVLDPRVCNMARTLDVHQVLDDRRAHLMALDRASNESVRHSA